MKGRQEVGGMTTNFRHCRPRGYSSLNSLPQLLRPCWRLYRRQVDSGPHFSDNPALATGRTRDNWDPTSSINAMSCSHLLQWAARGRSERLLDELIHGVLCTMCSWGKNCMIYFIVNSFEVLHIGTWGHVVGVLAIGGLDQSFLPWSGKLQVNQCYKFSWEVIPLRLEIQRLSTGLNICAQAVCVT